MHAIIIAQRSGHNDNMSEFGSVGIGRSNANQRIEMVWSIRYYAKASSYSIRETYLSLTRT